MQYLLVPVIMGCAICGTVGALKLIQKFFPNSATAEKNNNNSGE